MPAILSCARCSSSAEAIFLSPFCGRRHSCAGGKQKFFISLSARILLASLNAQALALSACQTGLGDSVRGEGLVGLTRGFMSAGTSRLVSIFSYKMLSQGMPPAPAHRPPPSFSQLRL
nr:CHAT domain-containing protein [Oscillatoria sp. PCC 10802]